MQLISCVLLSIKYKNMILKYIMFLSECPRLNNLKAFDLKKFNLK